MRWLAAVFALFASVSSCGASVLAVNLEEPRTFGYFIGDVLERRVEVITDGSTEFLTGSLPRPGPLTYWLDLIGVDHDVSTDGDKTITRITLKYQIFYSALEATELDIPAYPLKFNYRNEQGKSDVGNGESASIPALKLTLSPLRNIVLSDLMPNQSTEISDVLRPNVSARRIPMAHLKMLLALTLVGLALSAVALCYHYAIGPFGKRARRPFTIADRKIREIYSTMDREHGYRESLLTLHRAFDESFGRRLFASDCTEFLSKNRTFSNLAPKLAPFFEASQLFFFGDDRSAAKQLFSLEDAAHLASDLAHQERAAA